MNEKPILFNAPMVRAILAGQKTETRRVFKVGKYAITSPQETVEMCSDGTAMYISTGGSSGPYLCPYGVPGDFLWVRETWCSRPRSMELLTYAADDIPHGITYQNRPSIHMSRKQSRITLKITDILVERLKDITHEGAKAEGIELWAKGKSFEFRAQRLSILQLAYSYLWEEINGKGSWDKNQWVWVVKFIKI